MKELTVGNLVEYKNKNYWIYEDKGLKVILVPMHAMDFDEGIIKLTEAFQIDKSKLKLHPAFG